MTSLCDSVIQNHLSLILLFFITAMLTESNSFPYYHKRQERLQGERLHSYHDPALGILLELAGVRWEF